jgi:Mn-dependent DtxR family transcriptional regulator
MRQINSAAILRAVHQGGPASRPEIARLTGLSLPTVNSIVDSLLQAGYLCESAPDGSIGARRPGPTRTSRNRPGAEADSPARKDGGETTTLPA